MHEMSKPVLAENNKKNIINLSSAEIAYRLAKRFINHEKTNILLDILVTVDLGCLNNDYEDLNIKLHQLLNAPRSLNTVSNVIICDNLGSFSRT